MYIYQMHEGVKIILVVLYSLSVPASTSDVAAPVMTYSKYNTNRLALLNTYIK